MTSVTNMDLRREVNVLIACHNRRSITLSSISSLLEFCPQEFKLNICLVDDGSSDDTAFHVKKSFPDVFLIKGNGKWYWGKSMSIADRFFENSPRDLLWLNDDVKISKSALSATFRTSRDYPDSILVGQCRSEINHEVTYGGLKADKHHPFRFYLQKATVSLVECDTFNGNFVFIPLSVRKKLGPIDGSFGHRFSDLDYGLKASKQGIPILVMPGEIGTCERNEVDTAAGPLKRLIKINSRKELPLNAISKFAVRHKGITGLIYVPIPYIKAFFGIKTKELTQNHI